MRAIKFIGLTVFLLFAGIVTTIYAAFYAAMEKPLRWIGCTEIANAMHYLCVENINIGHAMITWADNVMGYGPGIVTDNLIIKRAFSVAYFDPVWKHVESVTVQAHCDKCAQYEVFAKPEEFDYVVVEAI